VCKTNALRTYLLSAMACVVLFASDDTQAKLPPQGISGGASSANIMLMLDVSGSMRHSIIQAPGNPYLGGLALGSFVRQAEFDTNGSLWKIDTRTAPAQILISSNGALVRQVGYSSHHPQFMKRYGTRMLVLYQDRNNSSIRHLVEHDLSGNVIRAVTSSGHSDSRQVLCASEQGVFIVDRNRYIQYSWNGLSLQTSRTLPTRPRSFLNGCADIGSGGFSFVLSDNSGRLYRFVSPTSFSLLGSYNQRYVNEDLPRGNRRYLAVVGSQVLSADASFRTVQTYLSSGVLSSIASVTRSPSTPNIAASGYGAMDGQPQLVGLPTGSINYTYYFPAGGQSRMALLDIARSVISDIVKDAEFNKRATFGLLTWASSASLAVPFGLTSNDQVISRLPSLRASGGTNLYSAMLAADGYIRGGSFANTTSGCSKTILIVISDGYWTNEAQANQLARNLRSQRNIETHVIGLGPAVTNGHPSYLSLATAGGSVPTSPMFARDMVALKTSLKEALYVALASTFSAVAPTVLPSSQIGNIVIQPTFEYAANGQWKGFLNAYDLDNNLNLSSASPRWRFHERLNSTAATSRRIWTASDRLGDPIASGLNNFTTANAGFLRDEIFGQNASTITSTATQDLIDFVRGRDVFDDDKDGNRVEDRWKLQDIYHSRPVFLARPKSQIPSSQEYVGGEQFFEARNPGSYQRFYDRWKNRREVVFAGSNSGLLHAIDAQTGQELWAFLPPPMKRKISELSGVNSAGRVGNSVSIYGIDGSIVARDIYTGGEWRTILAISFGMGARALTFMDVTDPDRPKHLFSVENRFENGTYLLNRWDSVGRLTVSSSTLIDDYPYRSLGFTTSAPVITFLRDSEDEYNPVAIVGAGSATSIDSGTGAALYVIDLSLASIGQAQRISIRSSSGSQPLNDLATDIEVIESGLSARMMGRYGVEVFLPNSNSVLDAVDLSGSTTAATDIKTTVPLRMLFDGQANTSNDRIVGYPISISNKIMSNVHSDPLNIIMGTGDMDRLAISPNAPPQNYVASIQGSESSFLTGSANLTLSSLSTADTIQQNQCPAPTLLSRGWKLDVNLLSGPNSTGQLVRMTHGKLSSKILQYGGSALFTVYAPQQSNACSLGNSCYVERDAACGFSKNIRCFSGQMLGGVTVYKDKVFISVSGGTGQESMPGGFQRKDNLITGSGTFSPSQSGSVNLYGRQIVR